MMDNLNLAKKRAIKLTEMYGGIAIVYMDERGDFSPGHISSRHGVYNNSCIVWTEPVEND